LNIPFVLFVVLAFPTRLTYRQHFFNQHHCFIFVIYFHVEHYHFTTSPPHSLVCLKWQLFRVEGKIELTVSIDDFGILHVIEKCLCVMFGFHLRIVHVSKDEAYDDNNNVIRSIYQIPVLGHFGLEWRVNAGRFRIIVKKNSKSFQKIFLTPKTTTSVANVVPHLVEIKQMVVPKRVDP